MADLTKSQIVPIEERRFRIDVLSARQGSWVLNLCMAKKMPFCMDRTLVGLNPSRPEMTEDEFHSVQDKLFGSIYELITDQAGVEIAKKIFTDGKFLIPSLEDDTALSFALTIAALKHTLLPFFPNRVAVSTETAT